MSAFERTREILEVNSTHDEVVEMADQSGKGKVKLRWLGHAAFEIESSGGTKLLDRSVHQGQSGHARAAEESRSLQERR